MEYHDTTIWKTAVADAAPKVILESTSFQVFPRLDRRFYEETTEFLTARGFQHIIDVRRIDSNFGEIGLDRKTLCRLLADPSGTVLCRLYDSSFPPYRYLFHKILGARAGKVIEFNVMLENGIAVTVVNASLCSIMMRKKAAFFYHAEHLKTLPKNMEIADFYQNFRQIMSELPADPLLARVMDRKLINVSPIGNAIRMMQCMYSSTYYKYDRDIYSEPFTFPGMKQQLSTLDLQALCKQLAVES